MLKSLLPSGLRNLLRPWKAPWFAFARGRVLSRTGGIVASGPFAGMKIEMEHPDLCKVLGTYEREIHGAIEELSRTDFERVLNIGGGEGYYTAGMARLFPKAIVTVFESDERKHQSIRRLALANGVSERVRIFGHCAPGMLLDALNGAEPTLLLMDVEGAEGDLLTERHAARLRDSHILLETHDGYRPGVGELIAERFHPTHELRRFQSLRRVAEDFPLKGLDLALLPGKTLCRVMDEHRPFPQEWFLLTPLSRKSAS